MKEIAEMYRTFAKSKTYEHLLAAAKKEAESKRRQATKGTPTTAWGDLRYADGVEWLESFVKQQEVADKVK